MGKLVVESNLQPRIVINNFDIDSFLGSRSSLYPKNMKELREAVASFSSIVSEGLKEDGTINYNGTIYTVDELYDFLIKEAEEKRRKKTDEIVDSYIASFKMFDGSLINNGISFDIVDDMKERVYLSYDYDTKTIEYLPGKKITLDELYQKYRAVNVEEQNEFTNAELCADMIRYIDERILESNIDGMNVKVREYLINTVPSLMHDGTNVEINNEIIPIQVFVKKIVDHQYEYLAKMEEDKAKKREEELNRTHENPNLVGLINVALKNNATPEVTTEIPVLDSSLLTEDEANSLQHSAIISPNFIDNYAYDQISRLKAAIYNTTNEHDLVFCENNFNEILSSVSDDNRENDVLIESVRELITKKRNSFIKANINSEDLIDITHGLINEFATVLTGATSADQFNELFGKVYSLYIDLLSKGIRDIQLDAKIVSFLTEVEKKRMVFDSTLTNISPEIQQIKFDLDEKMKRIRQEILAIECNKIELNQLSGKIIMITNLVEKARADVLNASHNHKFSDYNNKFTNDSLNYYLSQLEMYGVALDNMSKMGYGTR